MRVLEGMGSDPTLTDPTDPTCTVGENSLIRNTLVVSVSRSGVVSYSQSIYSSLVSVPYGQGPRYAHGTTWLPFLEPVSTHSYHGAAGCAFCACRRTTMRPRTQHYIPVSIPAGSRFTSQSCYRRALGECTDFRCIRPRASVS